MALFITILVASLLNGSLCNDVTSSDGNTPIIISRPPSQGSNGNRSTDPILISGYVDSGLSIAVLFFSNPCGTVEIEFCNLTTGYEYETSVNGEGCVIIPLSLSSGYWSVSFTLTTGVEFIGEFVL